MIDIIRDKLRRYEAANALEEENAVKEILQEVALYALWRSDFFDVALFQGRVRQGGVISAVAVGHRQAALAVMCRG